MPTYYYNCPICSVTVVVDKSIHDNEAEKCDNCNVPLVKQYFSPGLSFKGGGWAHKE